MRLKRLLLQQLFITFSLLSAKALTAQDTLQVKIQEAEDIFLANNLQLLAQRYSIDSAKAMILQARVYTNPTLSFSGNLYNPELKKGFDISNQTGQYSIGIQQLVILAGKRNKQIRLAETNAKLTEQSFYDLLRTLRFVLRNDFYNIYYLRDSYKAYGLQISSLESLTSAYEDLEKKGLVTLKDVVRIKSLLYSLKAEQASLVNQINDVESEVRLLLRNNQTYYVPSIDTTRKPMQDLHGFQLQQLIDTAYANRYDLRAAETHVLLNRQNYQLQKAIAVPDLTLGADFDKRGSFVENASFFNVAIDLPFFNRNQGNIKASKIAIDQSKVLLDLQRQTVENQVQNAYTKAINADNMLKSMDPNFRNQFETLLKAVTSNFQRKNLSLIEFTDFYQSYKDNILQLNQLQFQRMQAIEDLHFAVGKTLINY